jgi:hypothetical protein
MRETFVKKTFLTLLVALSMAIAIGCGESHHSRLRVVHASPDAPNVDVAVDDKTVLTNVAYGTASDYLTVNSGKRKIVVAATGTNTDVIEVSPDLVNKTDYTVLAVGLVANISPLLLTDDNAAPSAGNVKVRIIHGAPSAGSVDIYVTAPGDDLTSATPTLSNVAFKDASDYLSVPAGNYEIRVTLTGTKTVAIDSGSVTLTAGQIRTVVALDATGGGGPFTALVLQDAN